MAKNILEELELAPGPGGWQSLDELCEPDAEEKSKVIELMPSPPRMIAFISESPEREFELKAWAVNTQDLDTVEEWQHLAAIHKMQVMWLTWHLSTFMDEYNALKNAATDRMNEDRNTIHRLTRTK